MFVGRGLLRCRPITWLPCWTSQGLSYLRNWHFKCTCTSELLLFRITTGDTVETTTAPTFDDTSDLIATGDSTVNRSWPGRRSNSRVFSVSRRSRWCNSCWRAGAPPCRRTGEPEIQTGHWRRPAEQQRTETSIRWMLRRWRTPNELDARFSPVIRCQHSLYAARTKRKTHTQWRTRPKSETSKRTCSQTNRR